MQQAAEVTTPLQVVQNAKAAKELRNCLRTPISQWGFFLVFLNINIIIVTCTLN